MFKKILFFSSLVFLLTGCFNEKKEEKWTAFIYPKKEDTKNKIKSPITFSSLEECKKVSILEIKKQNLENIASFNCGLNCIYHEGMKLDICEKMLNE